MVGNVLNLFLNIFSLHLFQLIKTKSNKKVACMSLGIKNWHTVSLYTNIHQL